MEAPSWVTKELEKIHKYARLGWLGFEPKPGESNPCNNGTFFLLQLMHWRDADKSPFNAPWNARGPVYGSRWDRAIRVPMMTAKISIGEVFSGEVITKLRKFIRPVKERIIEGRIAKGKAYERAATEISGQASDYLLWKANKESAYSAQDRTLTKDCVTEEDKKILSGEYKQDFTTAFLPTPGSAT